MRVINKYKENPGPKAVWIMRGYKYGNPIPMKNKSLKERNRVCDEFKEYAEEKFTDEEILNDLDERDLVCCCKPLRCHGDYLLKRLDRIKRQKREL